MKELTDIIQMYHWASTEAYNWVLFSDIDAEVFLVMEAISGSIEFDILGE